MHSQIKEINEWRSSLGPMSTLKRINTIGKEDVSERLRNSEYVSRHFRTDSDQYFSFRGREYLKPIYDLPIRYLVILASRQAEKSTYISKDILVNLLSKRNEALLYTTAMLKHLDDFCHRKIDKQFDFREDLRKQYFPVGRSINNVRDKIASNGSTLSLRAVGTSPESARGIPARKVYFDETQSILSDNFPVVMECTQSYPDDSEYVFTGTPLTQGNYLSRLYNASTQYEWIIYCESCNKNQGPLGMDHIDLDIEYLFCQYCKARIFPQNGVWKSQNLSSSRRGYRISRLMTPTARWRTDAIDGILDKYEMYSETMFINEVLGLPHDLGSVPVTREQVYACCAEYDMMDIKNLPQGIRDQESFLVIDWAWADKEGASSYTIIAIGQVTANQKIKIIYVKRFFGPQYHNPDTVLNEIVETCKRFGVKGVGTDFGVGHKENLRLRPLMGKIPVVEYMYVRMKDEMPKYDKKSGAYKVNRNGSLDNMFSKLVKQQFIFPRREQIEIYAEDIFNIYQEYDPNYKFMKYEHADTGPDDFAHLLNYLSLMLERFYQRRIR